MSISLVVAIARNGVIGRDGGLPWHLPDELKYFRAITIGKPVVMGRRTFESIGKPLPGRHNIIVTRCVDYVASGCSVAASLEAALAIARGEATPDVEVMILGGADIFAAALPIADRLYLTEVHAAIEGDVFFPAYDASAWQEVSREHHAADERHSHAFDLVRLERR